MTDAAPPSSDQAENTATEAAAPAEKAAEPEPQQDQTTAADDAAPAASAATADDKPTTADADAEATDPNAAAAQHYEQQSYPPGYDYHSYYAAYGYYPPHGYLPPGVCGAAAVALGCPLGMPATQFLGVILCRCDCKPHSSSAPVTRCLFRRLVGC